MSGATCGIVIPQTKSAGKIIYIVCKQINFLGARLKQPHRPGNACVVVQSTVNKSLNEGGGGSICMYIF